MDPVTVDKDVPLGLLAVDATPTLLEVERVTGTLTAAVDAVLADPDGGAFEAAEDATLEVFVLADQVHAVLVGATFTVAALAKDVVVLAEAVDTGTLLDVGGPADVALALFSALAGPLQEGIVAFVEELVFPASGTGGVVFAGPVDTGAPVGFDLPAEDRVVEPDLLAAEGLELAEDTFAVVGLVFPTAVRG